MTYRDLSNVPHAVYRAYDAAGQLLYVGVTCDLDVRIDVHDRTAPWAAQCASMTVSRYGTRADAMAAEDVAIKTENPVYNIKGRPPGPPPVRVTLNLPMSTGHQLQSWATEAAGLLGVPRVSVQDALRGMIRAAVADQVVTGVVLDLLRRDQAERGA